MTSAPDAIGAHAGAAAAAVVPRARPEALRDTMPELPDTTAASSPPAADIAFWSALCAALAGSEDAGTSSRDTSAGVPPSPLSGDSDLDDLSPLAAELGAQASALGLDAGEACSFQLELPGLGSLSGRVTVRADQQVDLELRAMKPGVATALRARRQDLQQSIAHGTERDVNLFIL